MKLTSKVKLTLLPLVVLMILAGCYNDKEDQLYPEPTGGGNTCDTANMSYNTHIKPILTQYCTPSCHIGGGTSGGTVLNTYDGVKTYVTNNRLVGAVSHASGFTPMPQGMSKLSDCNINKITAWVNQGALNN